MVFYFTRQILSVLNRSERRELGIRYALSDDSYTVFGSIQSVLAADASENRRLVSPLGNGTRHSPRQWRYARTGNVEINIRFSLLPQNFGS